MEIAWGWSRAGHGSLKGDVIIGLARKELLDSYETLFAEAGIPIAAVTFSPAVIHSALRIWSVAPASLLCFDTDASDPGEDRRTEMYGESESRAVFSAEFSVPRERALALARAELRMAPDYPAKPLFEVLPGTQGTALAGSALAYAAAVAGSTAAGRRTSPTCCLRNGAPPTIACTIWFPPSSESCSRWRRWRCSSFSPPSNRNAIATISSARRVNWNRRPCARRRSNEKSTMNGNRILLLDEIKRRPQADLEVLSELTRLLPPQVWTNAIEIYPDSVVISGEADQAAPLLKVLDSSPLFQNSEFALSVTRTAQTEQFRIKTTRRGRAGRSTP